MSKLTIHGPATFKQPAVIETDKRINLFYGLNGSGKSTICRVLRNPTLPEHANCVLDFGDKPTLYVFNEDFIDDNFYVTDSIKGVFSLSKKNKDAEERIKKATQDREQIVKARDANFAAAEKLQLKLDASRTQAEISTFAIKRKYSGGDRVLEFCLEKMKADKSKLFDYILAIPLPTDAPTISIPLRIACASNAGI